MYAEQKSWRGVRASWLRSGDGDAKNAAGVLLVRRCPRCASAVASRPLYSLADLGRALEEDARGAAEMPAGHVCAALAEGEQERL